MNKKHVWVTWILMVAMVTLALPLYQAWAGQVEAIMSDAKDPHQKTQNKTQNKTWIGADAKHGGEQC